DILAVEFTVVWADKDGDEAILDVVIVVHDFHNLLGGLPVLYLPGEIGKILHFQLQGGGLSCRRGSTICVTLLANTCLQIDRGVGNTGLGGISTQKPVCKV